MHNVNFNGRIRLLVVGALSALSACATRTPPPTAYLFYHRPPRTELRPLMGTLEIAAATEPILVKAQRPQGLRENIRDATASVIHAADQDFFRGMRDDERKVEAWAYALPGLAVLGTAAGAAATIPRATIKENRRALTKAVDQMDLQQAWARQIYATCQRQTPAIPVVLAQANPLGSHGPVRSVLELRVASLSLVGAQAANPKLFLHLLIDARLRWAGHEESFYDCEFEYDGSQGYRLSDWAKSDAALLRLEIPRIFPSIAGRIVEILFTEDSIGINNLYSEMPN